MFPGSAIWVTHLGQEDRRRGGGSSKGQSGMCLGKVQGVISYTDDQGCIISARGASYRIKGKISKACVQSALTYGTETWAMKKANLQSLERTERMMVRWMCGVSLKDRKCSVELYSLLGVQSVDEVVRQGRSRWFGHVEQRKSEDDWVFTYRNVVVAGVRCADRGRKTWYECVKDDMKALGLHPEWAVFRDMWRGFISGGMSNPS